MRNTVVLGAGLQGVCVAMALARAGHRVTIVDRANDCLTRASLRNEGKIHLGFVYANDPTCRTSSLMLEAALSFGPLIEEWTGGPVPWARLSGVPFTYLILRDSLLPADQIVAAWSRLDARYQAHRSSSPRSYLGTFPERLFSPEPAGARRPWRSDHIARAIETAELALDMPAFQPLMREALANTGNVRCLFGHDVKSLERTAAGFRVEGTSARAGTWRLEGDSVVNCLWEGRLALDRQLGLLPARPWVYRLKYRLLGELPPELIDLPSLTLVLGKYGDIVNYGGGRVYLSWYPACLQGWSGDVNVPADWDRACRGEISDGERRDIATRSLDAFDSIVPGFSRCRIDSVAAGVIFSWGQTDIDDPSSELHRRDDIGPRAHDGYVTVNTGKLTTAPLFARRVVDVLG